MKNRGSVLIMVSWALFILCALALAISGYVRAQISLADKLSQKTRAYYLARAAVEAAILEIANDNTDAYDGAGDSWYSNDAVFKEVKFGNGTYSVLKGPDEGNSDKPVRYGLSDEESKINVNKAPSEVLKNFFEIVGGVDPEEAVSIAACIVDWRDEDDTAEKEGAESFYYSSLSRPYNAKNADMEVLEELILIKGITPDIFNKVKSRLTVYGSGTVNINTADELVLRSLGMSEELAAKVMSYRSGATAIFDDVSQIANALATKGSISGAESGTINNLIGKGLLGVSSDNFRGLAVGRTGSAVGEGKIDFVFDRKNNSIRYWRE